MTPEEKAAKEARTREFSARVRQTSIAVYKARLVQDSGDGAVERMIEKDGDDGSKLAGRAAAYDPLTRAYFKVLGIEP